MIEKGKVVALQWREISRKPPLPAKLQKLALRLIRKYKTDIIEKWVQVFVMKKTVKLKRIRGKEL